MSFSKKPDPVPAQQWECGWTAHEQMQLKRLAALPFAEKLAWLEEAHRLVRHLASGQPESGNSNHSSD